MNNEHDLLKQLQNLPKEAQAPDRWQAIEQVIEQESEQESEQSGNEVSAPGKRSWWLYAVAASALFVAALSPLLLEQTEVSTTQQTVVQTEEPTEEQDMAPEAYVLTIESLQQANASYYAKLGYMVNDGQHFVSPKTLASLDSLRQAQQQYRDALAEKPNSGRIQQKLFWLYQKERHILRQLVV